MNKHVIQGMDDVVIFVCVKVLSLCNGENFYKYSGKYFPAEISNGILQTSKFVCRVMDLPTRHNNGVERKINDYILVFWNQKNAPQGKGLADVVAKHLSPGQEISLQAKRRFYKSRIDGTEKVCYVVIPGTVIFGPISSKIEAMEIARWQQVLDRDEYPNIDFESRPALWNHPGTADYMLWNYTLVERRSEAIYNLGDDRYGYALVSETK